MAPTPTVLFPNNKYYITILFQIGMDILEAKERLVLQMPLVVGNIPLRKNFENLESESIFKYEKQFLIPFRHHKLKGLRKYPF